MKQLYEFAACIFHPIEDKKLKRASVLICEDKDGSFFIMNKEKVRVPNSTDHDPIIFEAKNGLFNNDCKIFLN